MSKKELTSEEHVVTLAHLEFLHLLFSHLNNRVVIGLGISHDKLVGSLLDTKTLKSIVDLLLPLTK